MGAGPALPMLAGLGGRGRVESYRVGRPAESTFTHTEEFPDTHTQTPYCVDNTLPCCYIDGKAC